MGVLGQKTKNKILPFAVVSWLGSDVMLSTVGIGGGVVSEVETKRLTGPELTVKVSVYRLPTRALGERDWLHRSGHFLEGKVVMQRLSVHRTYICKTQIKYIRVSWVKSFASKLQAWLTGQGAAKHHQKLKTSLPLRQNQSPIKTIKAGVTTDHGCCSPLGQIKLINLVSGVCYDNLGCCRRRQTPERRKKS